MNACLQQGTIIVLLLAFSPGTLWASGAVQRRQGINVRREIRPVPVKPRVTFQEPLVVPEAPKKEKPKVVLPPTPQQNVLMSSGAQNRPIRASTTVPVPTVNTPQTAPIQDGFYQEMARLFLKLDESSEAWMQIRDLRVKMLIVSRYIELFGQEGARIKKPALYYAQLIDNMVRQDTGMLANNFKDVLRAVAIMEYDFDNGTNRDALARSLLTGQAYIANKRRLGLQ